MDTTRRHARLPETFRAHGDEAVVLDYLKLAGEKVSRTVGNVYVETVKIAPGLFGLLYKIGMLVSRFSVVRRSIMSMGRWQSTWRRI